VTHKTRARGWPHLMRALGLDPARLEIVIYDLVKLVETVVDEAKAVLARQTARQILEYRRIQGFDVWFHLAAGRFMLATAPWPSTHPFPPTPPEYPRVDLPLEFPPPPYGAGAVGGCGVGKMVVWGKRIGLEGGR